MTHIYFMYRTDSSNAIEAVRQFLNSSFPKSKLYQEATTIDSFIPALNTGHASSKNYQSGKWLATILHELMSDLDEDHEQYLNTEKLAIPL
ncbi:hypothetical protein TNIN_125821 [Trichonephila inaurata madagascariensis]|uniref:Uncharacterized protein n=1 Tax=Trichonephila inaurata madagascariensis TaxID=2747483 RepID=A0A8X6I9N4_9ARAC|nr:hypothetical protein TNIN_125821 [Trichonephila inaurata madagascariensis]